MKIWFSHEVLPNLMRNESSVEHVPRAKALVPSTLVWHTLVRHTLVICRWQTSNGINRPTDLWQRLSCNLRSYCRRFQPQFFLQFQIFSDFQRRFATSFRAHTLVVICTWQTSRAFNCVRLLYMDGHAHHVHRVISRKPTISSLRS